MLSEEGRTWLVKVAMHSWVHGLRLASDLTTEIYHEEYLFRQNRFEVNSPDPKNGA